MTSTQGKGLSANVLPGMKHMSGIGAAMLVHEGVNRLGRAQEHDRVLDCVPPEARALSAPISTYPEGLIAWGGMAGARPGAGLRVA